MSKERREFNRRLAKGFKEIRESVGLSQAELAKFLRLDQSAISRVEQAKRELSAYEWHAAKRIFKIAAVNS